MSFFFILSDIPSPASQLYVKPTSQFSCLVFVSFTVRYYTMFCLFSHYYSSMMHHVTDFLLQPIFTRGVSASLNLVLLLVLVVYWVWKKVQVDHREKSERKGFRNAGFLYYKHSLVCSLVICVFNLLLCLLSYFYLYNNYGSEELVTASDLALKTVVWGSVCVFFFFFLLFSFSHFDFFL